jgi:hypothetical protein
MHLAEQWESVLILNTLVSFTTSASKAMHSTAADCEHIAQHSSQ